MFEQKGFYAVSCNNSRTIELILITFCIEVLDNIIISTAHLFVLQFSSYNIFSYDLRFPRQ
jgi:hypothetical protein